MFTAYLSTHRFFPTFTNIQPHCAVCDNCKYTWAKRIELIFWSTHVDGHVKWNCNTFRGCTAKRPVRSPKAQVEKTVVKKNHTAAIKLNQSDLRLRFITYFLVPLNCIFSCSLWDLEDPGIFPLTVSQVPNQIRSIHSSNSSREINRQLLMMMIWSERASLSTQDRSLKLKLTI